MDSCNSFLKHFCQKRFATNTFWLHLFFMTATTIKTIDQTRSKKIKCKKLAGWLVDALHRITWYGAYEWVSRTDVLKRNFTFKNRTAQHKFIWRIYRRHCCCREAVVVVWKLSGTCQQNYSRQWNISLALQKLVVTTSAKSWSEYV